MAECLAKATAAARPMPVKAPVIKTIGVFIWWSSQFDALPAEHGSGDRDASPVRCLNVTEDYLRRCGLDIQLDHGVDNMAMAMSLVASTRGLALMPAYAENLLPWSVISRPLAGEAPTIDLAVGYSKENTSPILKLFLSRIDDLTTALPSKSRGVSGLGPAATPR
jgi:DNA-binding transcriptional LysR family regulator